MVYDEIIKKRIDGETINYGIVKGNENVVFIKVGADGNIKGYKNKYLKMAHRVHEKIGATVICASNPYTETKQISSDKDLILEIISELERSYYKLYFFGTSDGAYHNLLLAKEFLETEKIVAVNSSFIDFFDFKDKLLGLSHINKTLIFGTEDDLYDYVPSLKEFKCDNLDVITVDGADHNFSGMLEEFVGLIDLL